MRRAIFYLEANSKIASCDIKDFNQHGSMFLI